MTTSIPQDDTRDRLLQAAGQEFAQRGFEHASVRTICEAAHANVSAVKYHFGSKHDLYLAVWEVAARQMVSSEAMPELGDGDDPERVLRDFIAWFMRLVLVETQSRPWTGQLLAYETLAPTEGALNTFVRDCCVPVRDELKRLVRAIAGPKLKRQQISDLVYALIAMCVNPMHSREVYRMLGHEVPSTNTQVKRLANNVAGLAISGLAGFRELDEGGE